jgi:hypothetical protein
MPVIQTFNFQDSQDQKDISEILEHIIEDFEVIAGDEIEHVFQSISEGMGQLASMGEYELAAMGEDRVPVLASADCNPDYSSYDEITIEFEFTDDSSNEAISIDKSSLKMFMFLFAPMMTALFVYEAAILWKQFNINRRAQYVKLSTSEKGDYLEEKSVKKPILLQSCIFGVSLFWLVAMMLAITTLLE